jgi:hypothetical protein
MGRGSHLPEDSTQRVGSSQGVGAIRADEECLDRIHPTSEQGEHVKGGFVSPMEVLQHQNSRSSGTQFMDKGEENFVRRSPPFYEVVELSAGHFPDREQGAERTRREQGIARTPEHVHRRRNRAAERTQKGRLPAPRFAVHEYHPAAALSFHRRESAVQQRKLYRPLEQLFRACRAATSN